ncbi:MAG: hypothetical protein FWE05_02985 [Defluviitaleaceae bacterium]|nr:hypothetical protein [Defluviitaleaceae bacterium]
MKKYRLIENNDPHMALRQIDWKQDNNTAIITWEWPSNKKVKLMLVFEIQDNPTLTQEILTHQPHEVITRDLASQFTANISDEKRRFLLCPAYFTEDKFIEAYRPVYVTDWFYKKTKVTAQVIYKPLLFSQFQKVTVRVNSSDVSQVSLISHVLKYVIYENGRVLGKYPLDTHVMAGAAHFYIKKNHVVKFILDDGYTHLLDICSH